MARIVVSLDGAVLGEYQLDKPRTSIGRRAVSDIHIDHLAISGEHAFIQKDGNNFYLEDAGSTNGTRVNGVVIKKHLLSPDDLIELGRYQLKFLSAVPVTKHVAMASQQALEDVILHAPSPVADHVIQNAKVQASAEETVKTADNTALQSNTVAKIQILNGANAGRELIINKALTTLGKVGTQVAVINKRENGYFISHIEGATFPSVNGEPIGVQGAALNANDEIELAGIKMAFYC